MPSPFRPCAITAAMIVAAILGAVLLSTEVGAAEAERASDVVAPWGEAEATEFIRLHCLDCHASGDAEGGLDLTEFSAATDGRAIESVGSAIDRWNRIADRVHDGQMPPPDGDVPAPEHRRQFVEWVRQTIRDVVCGDGVQPGAPMLRRLNRTEYANTIRDLLRIPIDMGHALPFDGAGGEGFDNAAETLFLSPIHAEKYLQAARESLNHAMKDPQGRKRLLVSVPSDSTSPTDAARAVLADFLPRAFRRPIESQEVEDYLHLFQSAHDSGDSFAAAVSFALEGVLVSPKFLFLWEEPHEGDEAVLLSHYEMASRLSYFLWASMPDETLLSLAAAGKLQDDDVLAEQVKRMLHSRVDRRGLRRDAKVRDFATSFTEQWLGTRALGREFRPAEEVARRYDSELEGGMKYEPIFFFEDILSDNRSLLNLIDSDFTYVNNRLSKHYRIRGEFREQPKRVDLPEGSPRGGLLGMGAVLAVSSFPHRTSPVLRGKWILETMLGTPPPPPPPGVEGLDEVADPAVRLSLRERLQRHRSDPSCASCHGTMDPLGFGLENFDVLGRWRDDVDGVPVDAKGRLPDGTVFNGPTELKTLLMQRKGQFTRHLTAKMLGYALARGLTHEDRCEAEKIAEKVALDDYRSHTLVREIVTSVPFRYKRGQSPALSADK